MPANTVFFVDTSVLVSLLRVPGFDDNSDAIQAYFESRYLAGARFVLPVTAIIETGNHIAQCRGDRRAAAERFVGALEQARSSTPPWTIRDVDWSVGFVAALVDGASTGTMLIDHLSHQSMGAGDIAILVERDQFRSSTAYNDVQVWTLDRRLAANS
jgi:hypothetical protein